MLGFVEFQNGTWNWKLWKLPNQSVFLSARALPQVSFEYLQGYIFHSLPGKLIPVLDQIIGKKKILLWWNEFSCISICVSWHLFYLWVPLEDCLYLLYFCLSEIYALDKIPLISLFSKLENSNCLCLSFLRSLSPCST